MLTLYMWKRFVVAEIRIGKMRETCFYVIFSFFVFKVDGKRTMNIFEGSEDFRFSNSIWLDRER